MNLKWIREANDITYQHAQMIASKYFGEWTSPPTNIPSVSNTDAPLIGNGDVGVAIGGGASDLTFYIGKTDFWNVHKGSIEPVGRIRLSIPNMSGASYKVVQDIYKAEVRGSFVKGENTLYTTSWVNANQNILVTDLKYTGSSPQPVTIAPLNGYDEQDPNRVSMINDIVYMDSIADLSALSNIGRDQTANGRYYFDGIIDDLRIYNRALSDPEMIQLCNLQDVSTGLSYRFTYNTIPTYANNTTLTSGKVNNSTLSYNGTNSYVNVGYLKASATWSIGTWIKVKSDSTDTNYIFSQGTWNSGICIWLSNGKLMVAYKGKTAESTSMVPTGSWVYVSGTYDGLCIKSYMNGMLVASKPFVETTRTRAFGKVRIATRILGTTATAYDGKLKFTMQPGIQYQIVTSIISNGDDAHYESTALIEISAATTSQISASNKVHRDWWQNFWGKSFIEIPNKNIEAGWYGSLYLMAIASRGTVAPGLWGSWISGMDPNWRGGYHLNYNYQLAFYSAYSTNHMDLTDNYDAPILDYIPKARQAAQENGFSGVYYPVGIGPHAISTYDGVFHNQKSNGIYAASNMIQRYYYTRDSEYADKIYGFLKELSLFWQNYLIWDRVNLRYIIENDAAHEQDSHTQTNSITSLGLLRFLLQGCIDISVEKHVDHSLRATWQDILGKLSTFPTMQRNNQTVFRLTEVGNSWVTDNSVVTTLIYPGNQIGINSDPSLLKIAYDTVDQKQAWNDENATSFYYPAAVRVGYSPNIILSKLDILQKIRRYPNFSYSFLNGGLENLSTIPSTLSEMMAQSFQHQIHVFANWPSDSDASFGNLMTYGGFLVSSKIQNNIVKFIRTISQKGRDAAFVNPWTGQTVIVYRNGINNNGERLSGNTFTIPTSVNEVIDLAPAGTSFAQIFNDLVEDSLYSQSSDEVRGLQND